MPKTTHLLRWRARHKQKQQRTGRGWLKLLTLVTGGVFTCALALFLGGGLAAAAGYANLTRNLPSYANLIEQYSQQNRQPAQIYGQGPDQNGDGQEDWVLLYALQDPRTINPVWVTLDNLLPLLQEAVKVQSQSHEWDTMSQSYWLGRVWQRPTNPTIPEQLARQLTPAEENLPELQPLREMVVAQQLTQQYTTNQLLEWHLNTAYFGQLAFGLEAAAQLYFGKPAAQLNLAELTLLLPVPFDPDSNPFDHYTLAKTRQEQLLETMVTAGVLDQDSLIATKFTPLTLAPAVPNRVDMIAPHFALYVQKELLKQFGPAAVLNDGLQVYTSLDLRLQGQAECVSRAQVARLSGAVGSGLPADEANQCPALAYLPPLPSDHIGLNHNVNNAAVVVLDPRTGLVKAMVGSVDEQLTTPNQALTPHQPAQLLTPLVYLTALAQGYTPATMLFDWPTDFGQVGNNFSFTPQNFDQQQRGPVSARQALANNLIIPTVELLSWVGADNTIRTGRNMGFNQLQIPADLSMVLGGNQANLLEATYAYGVFAHQGTMAGQPLPENEQLPGYRTLNPVTIVRVEDNNGQLLYRFDQPVTRELLTPPLAYLMNEMLADKQARCVVVGCPNWLELPNSRAAGVQTSHSSDLRDSWTVGYTPQLVTGVWLGNSDNSPMRELDGYVGAAPVWQAVMAWALADAPLESWPRPAGLTERPICIPSGLLDNGLCPSRTELFIAGTEPVRYDNFYQAWQVNRFNNRLATSYTPPELIETQTYVLYPERLQPWAETLNLPAPPTEYDSLTRLDSGNEEVGLTQPVPFAYLSGEVTILGNARPAGLEYYRLAYFEGLNGAELHTIAESDTPKTNDSLGVWDVSNLAGLYTLLLTAVRRDGSFMEVSIPVTIDNSPPTVALTEPRSRQTLPLGPVQLVATAQDNVGIERVQFYVGESGIPFEITSYAPYSAVWRPAAAGCYELRAVAVDRANNRTEGPAVAVCVE